MEEDGLPVSTEDLVELGAIDLVGVVEVVFVRRQGPISTQTMQLTQVTKLVTASGTEHYLLLRPDAKIVDMKVSGRDAIGETYLWEPGRRYRILGFPMEMPSGIQFIVVRAKPDDS